MTTILAVAIYVCICTCLQMMILFSSTGHCRPSLKDLCEHVVPTVADKWKDIGVHLLDQRVLQQITHTVLKHVVKRCLENG